MYYVFDILNDYFYSILFMYIMALISVEISRVYSVQNTYLFLFVDIVSFAYCFF